MRFIANSRNTVLPSSLFLARSRVLVFLFTLCFLALIVRAFWITGPRNAFYRKQGDLRVQRQLTEPAKRGRILDRNGVVLAENLPAAAVYAIPAKTDVYGQRYAALARLLHLSNNALETALESPQGFVYLARQVDTSVVAQVQRLALPGIYTTDEIRRAYPVGAPLAPLLGHVSPDGLGIEGVELAMQKALAATPGTRIVERDRMGRVVGETARSGPKDGQDIRLSIDERLQSFVYQTLSDHARTFGAKSALAVVTDVHTGEVLAAAHWASEEASTTSSAGTRRPRVFTDAFEPGSIIKPIIVATALDLGRVTPDTVIPTNGTYEYAHSRITDVHNFGPLSVAGVIQKSSNIGMVKIAARLSANELWYRLDALGFGHRLPEIMFPGQASGQLHSAKRLTPLTKAIMAYGYGMTTSPLQLAQAYATLGNVGVKIPLTLLRREKPPAGGQRIYSQATAAAVLQMMELVTTEGGSGIRARVSGYRVGGKTGTAYLHRAGKGYDKKHYRASFAGLAPLSAPDIAVVISVEDPTTVSHYGGKVAAPIFAEIVAQALHLRSVVPDAVLPASAGIHAAR